MRVRICAAFAVLAISGCAGGMSKDECLYADWHAIGYEDGARGAPTSAVSSRRQSCAKKANITADMDAYLAGRDEGLVEYCQPSNGFAVGARGARYYGVCSGPGEGEFVSAYQSGNQLYVLESGVAQSAQSLRAAENRLDYLRHEIDGAELALISPATPHADRVDVLIDLKNLREEHERVAASVGGLAYNHQQAEEDLADYRAFLAVEGPYAGAATGVTSARY